MLSIVKILVIPYIVAVLCIPISKLAASRVNESIVPHLRDIGCNSLNVGRFLKLKKNADAFFDEIVPSEFSLETLFRNVDTNDFILFEIFDNCNRERSYKAHIKSFSNRTSIEIHLPRNGTYSTTFETTQSLNNSWHILKMILAHNNLYLWIDNTPLKDDKGMFEHKLDNNTNDSLLSKNSTLIIGSVDGSKSVEILSMTFNYLNNKGLDGSGLAKKIEIVSSTTSCQQGERGETGPKGDKGEMGIKGEMGQLGPQGYKGEKGDSGIGLSGPMGQRGEKGERGIPGQNGAQGPEGPMGPQGWPGIHGTPGLNGNKGEIGPQGPQAVIDYNYLMNLIAEKCTFKKIWWHQFKGICA